MTATEIQSIVRILANQCHCRYWLNFFNSKREVKMAIQCLKSDFRGIYRPIHVNSMRELGFTLYVDGDAKTADQFIYIIERTNEYGTAFESKLF